MHKFKRESAVQYALLWALRRNPAYRDFSGKAGGRGDCTNFISQAMYAGGWPMTPGWWGDKKDAGSLWAAASDFIDFIESIGRAKICTRDKLDLGDLVSMNPHGGRIFHIMIITGKNCGIQGDELLYSCHTFDRQNRALSIPEGDGDTMCMYWKVADFFPI